MAMKKEGGSANGAREAGRVFVDGGGPGQPGFKSRLRARVARIRRGTWGLLAWVVISVALYYPAEALSDAVKDAKVPVLGAALLLLAVVCNYLGKLAEEHVAHWLYRDVKARVKRVEALIGVAHEIPTTERLLNRITASLDEIFGISGTAVYWVDHDEFELVSPARPGIPEQLDADDPLLLELKRYLRWQRSAVCSSSRLDTELAWPIEDGGHLVGVLLAGRAQGRAVFQEDEEVKAVQHLCNCLTHWMQKGRVTEQGKGLFFLACAQRYAEDVAGWFSDKFEVLRRYAATDALQTNSVADMHQPLSDLDDELGPEFNGVYVLNESGLVIEHKAPPGVDIRGKFDASSRPYFQACKAKMGPVVCDSLDTADRRDAAGRPIEILVAAVPRENRRSQQFFGILDAVIDLPKAPFGQKAARAAQECLRSERPRIANVRVLLIDSMAIVLGSSDAAERRARASVDASPEVDHLRAGLGRQPSFASEIGAIVPVRGTPFFAVAYEPLDLSAARR